MATSHFPVADIVQTRIMMETWAAVEAAGRPRMPTPKPNCAGLLTAMADPALGREEFHVLDAAFHVLAELAGRQRRRHRHDGVPAFGHCRAMSAHAIGSDDHWAAIVPTLRNQHEQILAAVFANDGDAAAGAAVNTLSGSTPTNRIKSSHERHVGVPATAAMARVMAVPLQQRRDCWACCAGT